MELLKNYFKIRKAQDLLSSRLINSKTIFQVMPCQAKPNEFSETEVWLLFFFTFRKNMWGTKISKGNIWHFCGIAGGGTPERYLVENNNLVGVGIYRRDNESRVGKTWNLYQSYKSLEWDQVGFGAAIGSISFGKRDRLL